MDSIDAEHEESQPKQKEAPACQTSNSPLLYKIVTFTVLILGVSQFAHDGNITLIYIACGMTAAQAGQPAMKNVLLLLKEKFLSDDLKG